MLSIFNISHSRQRTNTRRLRNGILLVALLVIAPTLYAATPGLPFTENFADTTVQDGAATTANWSTQEQALLMTGRQPRYGAFEGNITSRTIDSAFPGQAVAHGDIDGDGDLDVVVGLTGQPNRLYRNNGDGTFQAGTIASADSHPTAAVALGDVDNDGDLDLVEGNISQFNRLYLNDGSGNFASSSLITRAANSTWAVALGDVNNDGSLDLVTGNNGQLNRLYLNDGRGNFASSGPVTVDADNTKAIALGDIDNDGWLDVVAGNEGQSNKVYLNSRSGSFTSGSTITTDADETQDIALCDVDGDRDLDLVAGNANAPNRFYRNIGSGTFADAGDISSDTNDTTALVLGDIDTDGDLDLVAGNASQRNRLYLNNGSDTPWQGVTGSDIGSETDNTQALALSDIDGDRDLDLVRVNQGQADRVYINASTPNPWQGVTGSNISSETNAARAVALGDVNNDGDLDLVVGNAGQRNRLYLGDGSGGFSAGSDIGTATSSTQAVALGDVNNDGWLDLVAGNAGQRNRFYLNTGGNFTFNSDIGTVANSTQTVALGDVDGNGSLDLVAANDGQSERLYKSNATTTPWRRFILENIASARSTYAVALGDVDNDGDLDFVQGNAGQTNCLYRNNGTDIPWEEVTCENITAAAEDTQAVALGDVDNDGDLDIVTGNREQPNRLYLNDGSGGFSFGGTIGSVSKDTNAIILGDVNKDGYLDIVTGNGSRELNRLYLNNGSGGFSSGTTIGTTTEGQPGDDTWTTRALALGDVDADGWPDLVTGSFGQPNRLYLNDGSGNFLTGSDITTDDNNTTSIALADMNNDGDLDVLVGNQDEDNLLYRNDGSGGFSTASVTNLDALSVAPRSTQSLHVVDIDNDSDLDVVTGELDDLNRLYRNNGSGGFAAPIDISNVATATRAIVASDVNSDGMPDVAAGNTNQTSRLSYRLTYNTVTSMAQSLTTDTFSDTIGRVRLEASASLPDNTDVDYWVSNNGGTRWLLIQPGEAVSFPTTGSDLRWRADLHSLSPAQTPRIDQLTLTSDPVELYLPLVRR